MEGEASDVDAAGEAGEGGLFWFWGGGGEGDWVRMRKGVRARAACARAVPCDRRMLLSAPLDRAKAPDHAGSIDHGGGARAGRQHRLPKARARVRAREGKQNDATGRREVESSSRARSRRTASASDDGAVIAMPW